MNEYKFKKIGKEELSSMILNGWKKRIVFVVWVDGDGVEVVSDQESAYAIRDSLGAKDTVTALLDDDAITIISD